MTTLDLSDVQTNQSHPPYWVKASGGRGMSENVDQWKKRVSVHSAKRKLDADWQSACQGGVSGAALFNSGENCLLLIEVSTSECVFVYILQYFVQYSTVFWAGSFAAEQANANR